MTDELLHYRLDELKTLSTEHDRKLDTLTDDVTALKVKAGIWGAVGAGVVMLLGGAAQALGFHL